MARDKSSYISFPTPLEMGSSQPLDGRVVVSYYSGLTQASTWTVAGQYTNVYKGMLVSIEETNDVYEYIGGNGANINDVTNSSNWKLIASTNTGDIESEVSNILSNSGAGLKSDGTYSADTQAPYISNASNLAEADSLIANALSGAVQTIPHFTSGTSGSMSFNSGTKTLTLTWSENNINKSASTTINAESYEFASAATEGHNVVFTTGSGQGGSIQISANVDTIDCGEYTGTDRS